MYWRVWGVGPAKASERRRGHQYKGLGLQFPSYPCYPHAASYLFLLGRMLALPERPGLLANDSRSFPERGEGGGGRRGGARERESAHQSPQAWPTGPSRWQLQCCGSRLDIPSNGSGDMAYLGLIVKAAPGSQLAGSAVVFLVFLGGRAGVDWFVCFARRGWNAGSRGKDDIGKIGTGSTRAWKWPAGPCV